MYWKRLSHALLLGIGFSALGVGCAAVDALVSSPAGNSANRSSTQRMAAIGRVFENQGKYAKAQSMYRSALKADPSNTVARERLEYIAQMDSKRTFDGADRKTLEAFAVADALTSRKAPRRAAVNAEPPPAEDIQTVLDDASVIASLAPATATPLVDDSAPSTEDEIAPPKTEIRIVTASTDIGEVDVVDTGWELAGMADDRPLSASWNEVGPTFTDDTDVTGIATVGFEGSDTGTATVATMQAEWKSASPRIGLDQLLNWADQPLENQSHILLALQDGEDDGVKALASTLLIECPTDDEQIDRALEAASDSGSAFLNVTALDALVQRGSPSTTTVNRLLMSLRSVDPDIQTQAATSLRNLAGTDWARQCVDGLAASLDDDRPTIVIIAATTLGDFGESAAPIRRRLMDMFENSKDDAIVEAAGLALRRIPASLEGPTARDLPPASSVDIGFEGGAYLPVVE